MCTLLGWRYSLPSIIYTCKPLGVTCPSVVGAKMAESSTASIFHVAIAHHINPFGSYLHCQYMLKCYIKYMLWDVIPQMVPNTIYLTNLWIAILLRTDRSAYYGRTCSKQRSYYGRTIHLIPKYPSSPPEHRLAQILASNLIDFIKN